MSAQPFPRPVREPADGHRIGRYRVRDILGRGAMGVVYLADDPLIGRPVAVKTLSPAHPLAGEKAEALRRHLLNEAASAGALSHPGIVTIHDVVDDADGRVSIAMEYVPGETLKERLARDEPLPLRRIAEVVSQIAEVLDFVHARGVVHRDIKPANVILRDDGGVKITDFGIASLRGRDLAHELEAMGTPSYLPPERLLGQEADHRADVYALGVLLYEMLTRHLPFHGESLADLVRNTVQGEPTPVETFRPDLPAAMRQLLARALAKDPLDRYQTAGELAAAVATCVARQHDATDTQPITRVIPLLEARPRPDRWRSLIGPRRGSRRPPLRALLLLGGSLAAAVALVALLPLGLGGGAPADADAEAALSAEQRSQVAYLQLLAEVQRLYEAGDRAAAERLIAGADPQQAARIRELQREAWWEAETERAIRQVVQRVELLQAAEDALDRGDLATADAALYKLRELAPDDVEAVALRSRLARARRARLARQPEDPAPVPVADEPQPPPFEPFELDAPPAAPAPPPFGRLKIDFQSQLPRGVLTIYAGGAQILSREYRFFDRRRGLLRRSVPRPGGFDEVRRLPAGDLELMVYVSGPQRPTRLETLRASLPGGTERTLVVRLDESGELSADFH